ncbi:MAG TPA: TolC family protein [Gammaproteobacteria bacterium]|nr:TolC family protein [Gammaproteobacteria bacterium]
MSARIRPVALLALSIAAQGPLARADEVLRIDLGSALRLADERNLDVAIYYQRVAAADAALAQARLLAVPTIRVGSAYDRHHGNIQETSGVIDDVDRVSQFSGVTASIGVDVANAIYAPLAARQSRDAVRASSDVNRHRVLVDVASGYLRLLQARAEEQVVAAALERANDLAALTHSYAEAGEGLVADAQMAAVQPLIWEQRQLAAREAVEGATAEVARLLHLDAGVALEPIEQTIPALELYTGSEELAPLVERALHGRPEAEQLDALHAAAEDELKARRFGWFIPGVALSYASGEFGGAPGSEIANTDHRDDLSLQIYWQFEGLGFGRRAKIETDEARLREVGLQRDKLHDAIVAEVRDAYASTRSRRGQLPLAEAAVAHAAEAYELHRARIYDKQGLPLEALQAMQALAAAELARIDALVGYDLAQIRLHTVLGNPLEIAP